MPKCFNGLCRFQNLVTTIDYKCGYYLNKSNLMAITVQTNLDFYGPEGNTLGEASTEK